MFKNSNYLLIVLVFVVSLLTTAACSVESPSEPQDIHFEANPVINVGGEEEPEVVEEEECEFSEETCAELEEEEGEGEEG